MRRSTVYLTAALAGALGYAGYLQLENARLREGAGVAPEFAAAVASRSSEPAPLAGDPDAASDTAEPRGSVAAAPYEPSPPEAAAAPAPERQASWQDRRRERAQRFMAAFDDPEMRLDMVERQMERVDGQFGAFFRRSSLRPEEIDIVKTLLAEREVTRWEERMKGFSLEDAAARDSLRADMDAKRLALTAEIATVLGEDEMAQLEFFESGLPFRRDVESFASSLSYTEAPLTEAQSERLVAGMAQADREFQYTKDLSELRRDGFEEVSPEEIDRYFQERAARDDLMVANAREALSPDQLRAFAERRLADRERDRREMEFRLQARERQD